MTFYTDRPEVVVVERDLRVLVVFRREPDDVVDVRRDLILAARQTVLAKRMLLEIGTAAGLPRPRMIKRLRDASHGFAPPSKRPGRDERLDLCRDVYEKARLWDTFVVLSTVSEYHT